MIRCKINSRSITFTVCQQQKYDIECLLLMLIIPVKQVSQHGQAFMFIVPTLTVALAPSFDSPVHVRTEVFTQRPALLRTACPDGALEPSISVKRVWLWACSWLFCLRLLITAPLSPLFYLFTAPLSPLFYLRLLCHSRLTTALESESELLIAIAI